MCRNRSYTYKFCVTDMAIVEKFEVISDKLNIISIKNYAKTDD